MFASVWSSVWPTLLLVEKWQPPDRSFAQKKTHSVSVFLRLIAPWNSKAQGLIGNDLCLKNGWLCCLIVCWVTQEPLLFAPVRLAKDSWILCRHSHNPCLRSKRRMPWRQSLYSEQWVRKIVGGVAANNRGAMCQLFKDVRQDSPKEYESTGDLCSAVGNS